MELLGWMLWRGGITGSDEIWDGSSDGGLMFIGEVMVKR